MQNTNLQVEIIRCRKDYTVKTIYIRIATSFPGLMMVFTDFLTPSENNLYMNGYNCRMHPASVDLQL